MQYSASWSSSRIHKIMWVSTFFKICLYGNNRHAKEKFCNVYPAFKTKYVKDIFMEKDKIKCLSFTSLIWYNRVYACNIEKYHDVQQLIWLNINFHWFLCYSRFRKNNSLSVGCLYINKHKRTIKSCNHESYNIVNFQISWHCIW